MENKEKKLFLRQVELFQISLLWVPAKVVLNSPQSPKCYDASLDDDRRTWRLWIILSLQMHWITKSRLQCHTYRSISDQAIRNQYFSSVATYKWRLSFLAWRWHTHHEATHTHHEATQPGVNVLLVLSLHLLVSNDSVHISPWLSDCTVSCTRSVSVRQQSLAIFTHLCEKKRFASKKISQHDCQIFLFYNTLYTLKLQMQNPLSLVDRYKWDW